MCAWAGYYGWLHAPQRRDKDSAPVTWFDIYGDAAWQPEPESEYLASHWAKCGRIGSGFNGPMPLDWLQIKSYTECMRVELQPWECECLRAMSQSYVHWYNKIQTDFNADPPILPDDQSVIDEMTAAYQKRIKAQKAQ